MRSIILLLLCLMSAGCMGHCGPSLDAVSIIASFDGFLSDANRTLIRVAFEEQGFESDPSQGPGGFHMHKDDVQLFVANRTATTEMEFDFDVPRREYQGGDQAHSAARKYLDQNWPRFNTTMDAFEAKTGWTQLGLAREESRVVIC
jgi:hypothetical protein